MVKRITRREREYLYTLSLSLLAFVFLHDTIKEVINKTFPNTTIKLIMGVGLIIFVLYNLDIK